MWPELCSLFLVPFLRLGTTATCLGMSRNMEESRVFEYRPPCYGSQTFWCTTGIRPPSVNHMKIWNSEFSYLKRRLCIWNNNIVSGNYVWLIINMWTVTIGSMISYGALSNILRMPYTCKFDTCFAYLNSYYIINLVVLLLLSFTPSSSSSSSLPFFPSPSFLLLLFLFLIISQNKVIDRLINWFSWSSSSYCFSCSSCFCSSCSSSFCIL